MLLLRGCCRRLGRIRAGVRRTLVERLWARPAATHLARTGAELRRTRGQLLAEKARLRQPLVVVHRSVKRPVMTTADRTLLVLLAGRIRTWRPALLVVRPDTLLRWQRAGFRALWCRKSRPGPGRPPPPAETVARIRRMADENPLWGAERIRGERQKLGRRVAKRTSLDLPTDLACPAPPRARFSCVVLGCAILRRRAKSDGGAQWLTTG